MIRRATVLLFFLGYFITGWLIVDDYGVTFDEAIQRRHGLVTVEYVADQLGVDHGPLTDGTHGFAPYGMIYQMTAVGIELLLDANKDPYVYYRIRHILNFLLFGLALICFYRLLRLRWPVEKWIPLVGTVVLLASPRIFAHAFFNPKDHILLVFYLLATYTLFLFLKHRNWRTLCLHIVVTALALNTRSAALIIVAVTLGALIAEQVFARPKNFQPLIQAAVYLPASLLIALPFFPFLWQDTGQRAASTVTDMANYGWGGDVLFFGTTYAADSLPWYYVPAWVTITTPIIYLLFIVIGIGITVRTLFPKLFSQRLWSNQLDEYDLIQLILALGPLMVVILLGSTVYNGWRHLHFIYPPLVYLLVLAYHRLSLSRKFLPGATLAIGVLMTTVAMYRMHPHQQVFFNGFIQDEYALQRFDMDYWGASYRSALLQLAAQIPDGQIRKVRCMNWPCEDNIRALPPAAKEKIQLEDKWHLADYVATNFAYATERTAIPTRGEYFSDPAVELYPDGKLIIGIYRVNK